MMHSNLIVLFVDLLQVLSWLITTRRVFQGNRNMSTAWITGRSAWQKRNDTSNCIRLQIAWSASCSGAAKVLESSRFHKIWQVFWNNFFEHLRKIFLVRELVKKIRERSGLLCLRGGVQNVCTNLYFMSAIWNKMWIFLNKQDTKIPTQKFATKTPSAQQNKKPKTKNWPQNAINTTKTPAQKTTTHQNQLEVDATTSELWLKWIFSN